MSKIEINKEIVLLRKNVNQAKVHIIKKQTREVMKLRKYKGPETQKEKRTRKADRLAAEILAIKNMKNDEVTKYILTHPLNLKEVLDNKDSDSLTRMMARIASHKIFSQKIEDFKKKYPNYMEFLGPGRKKKAIMEWKEKKKLKKKEVDAENSDTDKLSENEESEEPSGEESSEGEDESDGESSSEPTLDNAEQLQNKIEESEKEESSGEEVAANDVKTKVKNVKKVADKLEKIETTEISKPEKPQKRKKEAGETKEDAPKSEKPKKKKKTDIPKVISKQAVVKKFTDILKEDESNVDKEDIDNETTEPSIQVEKEEDPFFVTGDGQSNYLSVAPIKSKSENQRNDYDDDDDDYHGNNRFNKKKFSRQDPDKYFSNVSKFKNGNFNKADARWDGPKRNGKAYDKEKPGRKAANFSKFNDEQRDKSKPFRKQSKGAIESTSNEILHPSWEAKKKQQEALKKGFQGKKIVFGDDDA